MAPLYTILLALCTGIATTIATRDVILDKKDSKRHMLTRAGYGFLFFMVCVFVFSILQYFAQEREQKEHDAKQQQQYEVSVERMRLEFAKSVLRIRAEYDTGNDKTLAVIGQTLAKYGYQLDTTNKRLIKLIHDSGNIKQFLADQPVLDVSQDFAPGIVFLKLENGVNQYKIYFTSLDGASCCFDVKISALVQESRESPFLYKGLVPVLFNSADYLAKNEWTTWTFSIDNLNSYDLLYLWIR